jgi:BirA family transcriptional regulator, biotin operon repressor / biotin---[acetyl-CoA-carboxylase] ligase
MSTLTTSIIRYDSLGSTNTEAASWAMQGAPEGFCVVASEQTRGRGRLERKWLSPKDAGLYFSIVLRPQIDSQSLPLVTLMASLAVRDTLFDVCNLSTDIKWPNDVLANGRKLSGILAEVVDTTIGRAVVVGIGINLAKESLPPELSEIAISVEAACGKRPDLEEVLDGLTKALSRRYSVLQSTGGAATTVKEWCEASSYAEGRRITVTNNGEILEGTTRGLARDGALRVETEAGQGKVIRAGDVSLRPFDA